jgi:tetratricopeptide (TPR) repeat protein
LLARLRQRQSRFREAASLYRQVIRLARRTGNKFEEARACSNLGYLYIDAIGHWPRAEVLCCHALVIYEALAVDHGRAHVENHLGVLYTRQHGWPEAEQHLQRACALWQAMGDHHSLIYGFENLGLLYLKMEHPVEAHAYLEKALAQSVLTGEEAEIGNIWNNLTLAYWQSGDLEKAETYARQAERVFRRFSNVLGLAQAWNSLGLVYFQQKRWAEAIQYLEHSLMTYRSLSNREGEIEVLLDIIEYELAREDRVQASIRLDEVEGLINQQLQGKQKDNLNERLKKYRRSLAQPKAQATAAILDYQA